MAVKINYLLFVFSAKPLLHFSKLPGIAWRGGALILLTHWTTYTASGLGSNYGRVHLLCSVVTVPLSTQMYKWLLANLMLGVTLRWTIKREVN